MLGNRKNPEAIRGRRYASRAMPTSVVTGGAGFLGSHLCDSLLAAGHRVICVDNLETGSLANIEHMRSGDFVFIPHDLTARDQDRRAGRLRLPPRQPGEPDRLPPPAAADAQGRLVRHAQRARPRQVQARPLPARLDERGLRRPAGAPAARDVLGQREPDRPARRLRRGEALRRGADDGVPPPAGRRHRIVRIFNTYGPRMRPHDGRAIPTFVRQALEQKPLTVFGDGSQTRSFCYVDDLVRGRSCSRRAASTCP